MSRSSPKKETRSDSSPPHSPDAVDYRRLFERAGDAILVVDAVGRYVEANASACRLTGYSREELLGMKVGDLALPSDLRLSADRFALLRRRGVTRGDRVLLRKDGSQVVVEAHAVALGDGGFQTLLRDISDRVADRAALEQSLDAYSTLVDLCNAAVLSAGPDGRIKSWNRGAEALFGYSAKEAFGLPIAKLIPESLQQEHETAFARHVRSAPAEPYSRTLHSRGVRKNGTELAVEVYLAIGRQADGQIFTAVIRDVSEQDALLDRLNDALQRLQFHVERMPLAYIVWNKDFHVLEWNPAAERIFGYSKAEAVGRHAYDLLVPPDVVPEVDLVWADILHGVTSSHSINPCVRKDGSRLTCEWFNTPLHDSNGLIRGVASMAMDVSEREALESRMRDAQKLESLGVLTGGMAHDFNSSLMVILGNTSLLRSVKKLPAKAMEHIELIEEAGSRADELIKHLLAYARTGRHNPQPTDLNAVVRDGAKLVRSAVGAFHDLEISLDEKLPTIITDRSQIEQIILNLCLNARDAMDEGGTIVLSTRSTKLSPAKAARCIPRDAKAGRYVELLVRDTGCGMDAATVERMFDPFFTTKAEGHGLGMAAALGILRQHRAVALVESEVGKGTSIRVFFPIPEATAIDQQARSQTAGAKKSKTRPPAKRRRVGDRGT